MNSMRKIVKVHKEVQIKEIKSFIEKKIIEISGDE